MSRDANSPGDRAGWTRAVSRRRIQHRYVVVVLLCVLALLTVTYPYWELQVLTAQEAEVFEELNGIGYWEGRNQRWPLQGPPLYPQLKLQWPKDGSNPSFLSMDCDDGIRQCEYDASGRVIAQYHTASDANGVATQERWTAPPWPLPVHYTAEEVRLALARGRVAVEAAAAAGEFVLPWGWEAK